MSHNHKNEKSEEYPASRRILDIDDRFSNLSCPFTWGMKNVIESPYKLLRANEDRFEHIIDLQDHFPEYVLIYHLMLAYENVISNDLSDAEQSVNNAEKSLTVIKEKATLKNVENALQHIFVATKCHVLQKLDRESEVDEILYKICDVHDMNYVELAMLNGCQCLAWSLNRVVDNLEAINSAKKAIEYDRSNGKWHFLLGKNYRRLRRRRNSTWQKPSQQEISAFEEAFRLSENVLFGVSLAQLHRESLNYKMANQIYRKVYDLQPTCCKVRLQLALGFIRAKQCGLAKDCLDYVAENMPNSNIYAHYMAIYHEKCNNDLKAAVPYYETTTKNFNYAAEWQYIQCRRKVEQSWDPLPYMLGMLKKYEDTDYMIQGINIQVGAYYLFEMNDVLSACQYLTKAMEISPNATILKKHFLLFHKSDHVNIYHVLIKEIQFTLQFGTGNYDEDGIAVLNNTLKLCHENSTDLLPTERSRAQDSRSQLSSGNGNNDRVPSSYVEITDWREKRSSPTSRGFSRDWHQKSSGDGLNSSSRSYGSNNEKDHTTWRRSVKQVEQDRHNDRPSSSAFQNSRDSTVRADMGRRDFQQTVFSQPRNQNDSGEDASCCLVKNVRNLNL